MYGNAEYMLELLKQSFGVFLRQKIIGSIQEWDKTAMIDVIFTVYRE